MGKTYRRDQDNSHKKQKHANHANGKKTGGMKIVRSYYDEDDDFFDDEVEMHDAIDINKARDSTIQ